MDPLDLAASGMHSASLRLAASAHNVANLTTDSPRPLRTIQTSAASGGSEATLVREPAGRKVDLTREIVEQTRASTQYNASLRVFSVVSEMQGQLIDLLA